MRESVLEFGPDNKLVGILCRPDHPASAGSHVTVLITNAGIIHRVGANRIHVGIARALAATGIPCLRYDLPGIGDSDRVGSGGSLESEQVGATIAALDALTETGIGGPFVLMGLCSGADHSLRVACTDSRIAGAVLIDPTVMFSTARHRTILRLRALRRMMRPRFMSRVLSGRLPLNRTSLGAYLSEQEPGSPRSVHRGEHPDMWSQSRAAFNMLIARRTRLLLLTTAHSRGVYSYQRQLHDAFPDLSALDQVLRSVRLPRSDHTFSAESSRRDLERVLTTWIAQDLLPALPADANTPKV